MKVKLYKSNKARRQIRTRSKVQGTSDRPRLTVFKSNKYMQAQLVDDMNGKTLITVNAKSLSLKKANKTEAATEVGKKVAEGALEKGIKQVVFDRGSYKYHGRVKALAEGAREKGLKF